MLILMLTIFMWLPALAYEWRRRSLSPDPPDGIADLTPLHVSCYESSCVEGLFRGDLDRATYRARMERIAAGDAQSHPLMVPES